MNEEIQEEITQLATILEKLLKVIRHSDPTAEEKKKLLFQKYRTRLESFSKKAKLRWDWPQTQQFLEELFSDSNFALPKEVRKVILQRLTKDLETQFVKKQVLPDLTKTPVKADKKTGKPKFLSKQKPYARMSKKTSEDKSEDKSKENQSEKKKPEVKKAEKQYTREDLYDMAVKGGKQKQATQQLTELVEAIRRLDPEKLEQKINLALNKRKP